MDTLMFWRLVGICLALSGMTALPHVAGAQGAQPERLRAECPTQTGTIGDWDWSGHANGFTLWAINVKILERGTYVPIDKGPNAGKVSRFFLTDIAGRWKMETNTSRKPATETISIVATGAQVVASGEVPSSVFTPLGGKAKPEQAGPFYATIEVTPLFAGKVHPARCARDRPGAARGQPHAVQVRSRHEGVCRSRRTGQESARGG